VEEARVSIPRLHFRLPGTWHSVDLRGGAQSESSIKAVVRDVIGAADDRAHVRADLRRDLRQAVRAAQEAEARSMMFSTEIAPGSPLPVTLVVYAPTRLRMSPTIGTEPDHVLAVLSESLRQSSPELAASLTEVSGGGGPALRSHRVQPIEVADEPAVKQSGALRLMADYWVPVPQTKQVVMVRFSTPMGEIENIMLSLFDALVRATYFRPVSESEATAVS
jgi:hypothetical protein